MPQNITSLEGKRRGTHCSTFKANGLVSCQAPGLGLANGASPDNVCPARFCEKMPAGQPNGTKLQCMVNGYINHGYKGKRGKAVPSGTLGNEGSRISAAIFPSAEGRVCSRDISCGILVTGATSSDALVLPRNSGQTKFKSNPSEAAAKNQRRRKKFKQKRDTTVVGPANSTIPLMATREEENWENEIQEVIHKDWEKLYFGPRPYGPDDLLHFSLWDLTLKQRDAVDLLTTAHYTPAVHHPHPVRWSCYKTPTEPDQFADADEVCDVVRRPREVWLLLLSGSSTTMVT